VTHCNQTDQTENWCKYHCNTLVQVSLQHTGASITATHWCKYHCNTLDETGRHWIELTVLSQSTWKQTQHSLKLYNGVTAVERMMIASALAVAVRIISMFDEKWTRKSSVERTLRQRDWASFLQESPFPHFLCPITRSKGIYFRRLNISMPIVI